MPPSEAWNLVGATSEPGFLDWTGSYPSVPAWNYYRSAAFYKDPLGIVRLSGVAFFNGLNACTGKAAGDAMYSGTVFTLPAAYRPDVVEDFACLAGNADLAGADLMPNRCEIAPSGEVTVPGINLCLPSLTNPSALGQNWVVAVGGISFRAGTTNVCDPAVIAACAGKAAGNACYRKSTGIHHHRHLRGGNVLGYSSAGMSLSLGARQILFQACA